MPGIYKSMLYGEKKKSYPLLSRIRKLLINQIFVYRIFDSMGGFLWKVLLFKNRISIYGLKMVITNRFPGKRDDRADFIIDVEDKSLREILGSEYLGHKSKTKSIPGVSI